MEVSCALHIATERLFSYARIGSRSLFDKIFFLWIKIQKGGLGRLHIIAGLMRVGGIYVMPDKLLAVLRMGGCCEIDSRRYVILREVVRKSKSPKTYVLEI